MVPILTDASRTASLYPTGNKVIGQTHLAPAPPTHRQTGSYRGMVARSRHTFGCVHATGFDWVQEAGVIALEEEGSMCLSFSSRSPTEISQARSGTAFCFTGPAVEETKSPDD